ncbi:MAG: hypothetical protein IJW59_04385 [Clostridia bacterium]|nr:hypothetical protein [Clostridia bacterium]
MVNNVVACDNDNRKKESKFNILKLISKKNFKIVFLVGIAILCGIFVIAIGAKEQENVEVVSSNTYYRTTLEYCQQLENKLTSVLSSIKGAGNISVMISVDGSPELVYAEDVDKKVSSNASGTTTTSNSSSPIIINIDGNSNALVLTENLPKVKGVIVVSSGASDIGVKLDILNAVSTLLDISTEKVSVLKGI